jgi:hypothetical protein
MQFRGTPCIEYDMHIAEVVLFTQRNLWLLLAIGAQFHESLARLFSVNPLKNGLFVSAMRVKERSSQWRWNGAPRNQWRLPR